MAGAGKGRCGNRHSEERKAEALAALAANGGNVAATARQLGVPRKTLARWPVGRHVSPAAVASGQQKKGPLADRLEEVARQLADALADKIAAATLQQTATSLGIAIDKMQLLRGKPTGITSNLSGLTDEQLDQRIRSLEDQLAAGQGGEAAPAPDPAAPAG